MSAVTGFWIGSPENARFPARSPAAARNVMFFCTVADILMAGQQKFFPDSEKCGTRLFPVQSLDLPVRIPYSFSRKPRGRLCLQAPGVLFSRSPLQPCPLASARGWRQWPVPACGRRSAIFWKPHDYIMKNEVNPHFIRTTEPHRSCLHQGRNVTAHCCGWPVSLALSRHCLCRSSSCGPASIQARTPSVRARSGPCASIMRHAAFQ